MTLPEHVQITFLLQISLRKPIQIMAAFADNEELCLDSSV